MASILSLYRDRLSTTRLVSMKPILILVALDEKHKKQQKNITKVLIEDLEACT